MMLLHQHPVREKISLHRGLLSFKTIILKGLWQDKVNVNLKKRRWQHWSINQVVALNFLQSCHSSNLPSTCNRRGYYYDYLFICFACSSLIAALFQGYLFLPTYLGVLPFSKTSHSFFFFSSFLCIDDEEIKIQIYLQEVSFPDAILSFFCFFLNIRMKMSKERSFFYFISDINSFIHMYLQKSSYLLIWFPNLFWWMDDVYFRYIAIKLSSCTHVQSHLRLLYTYVVLCGSYVSKHYN